MAYGIVIMTMLHKTHKTNTKAHGWDVTFHIMNSTTDHISNISCKVSLEDIANQSIRC